MAIRNLSSTAYKPISGKGRVMLSAAMLLLAFVLGMAIGVGLFHAFAGSIRNSEMLGSLFCGEGMRVGRLWIDDDSSRIVCFDAAGRPLTDRGSALGLFFGLPFFLLLAVPTQMFAWRAKLRGHAIQD